MHVRLTYYEIYRFVRFVSTPEILERVYTLESEILQIEEAIAIQGNNDMGMNTVSKIYLLFYSNFMLSKKGQSQLFSAWQVEDYHAKPVESIEGTVARDKYVYVALMFVFCVR